MDDDEFQRNLRSHRQRQIPSTWRSQILAAARQATPEPRPSPWYLEWLWPCPQAWAALAGAWIVIVVVQFQSGALAQPVAEAARGSTPARMIPLAERQRELGEVLDLFPSAAVEEKKLLPGPRGGAAAKNRFV
jgi:hypothetical protein